MLMLVSEVHFIVSVFQVKRPHHSSIPFRVEICELLQHRPNLNAVRIVALELQQLEVLLCHSFIVAVWRIHQLSDEELVLFVEKVLNDEYVFYLRHEAVQILFVVVI